MNILSILHLFGGVGLFLFGMSLMGSSLEKLAGSSLEKILETLTTSKKKGVGALKGFGLGLGVTGIIQSSAATTLMLIGFVNAGIMRVSQSVPVVLGSNIGSTITAQILRLGDLSSDNIALQLLKPSSFAPMLMAVGAFMHIFLKKQKTRNIAGILIGLGALFYGMTQMEAVFEPLKDSPAFHKLFTSFSNPILGILIGLVLTALIQSSSASVGILQALSATGSVTYGIAIPIIIGQNVGKCMTILLGSVGATKKAKRVAYSYLLFNIFGAVLFTVLIYGLDLAVGLPFMQNTINRGGVATLHLGFNLLTALILLPLSDRLSDLTGRIVKDTEQAGGDEEFKVLDDMLLSTPGIALKQCIRLMNKMGEKLKENYAMSVRMIDSYDPGLFPAMEENENFIDRCETELTAYIIKIDRKRLTRSNRLLMSSILNSIGDFERIGDYAINIAYVAKENAERGISFSDAGKAELSSIMAATKQTLETVLQAFFTDNLSMAVRVEPLAVTIEKLHSMIKSHHVARLEEGICSVEGGIALNDLLNSCERISGHAANVALHTVKRVRGDSDFDEMHGHVGDTSTEEYKALESYYATKYIDPVK